MHKMHEIACYQHPLPFFPTTPKSEKPRSLSLHALPPPPHTNTRFPSIPAPSFPTYANHRGPDDVPRDALTACAFAILILHLIARTNSGQSLPFPCHPTIILTSWILPRELQKFLTSGIREIHEFTNSGSWIHDTAIPPGPELYLSLMLLNPLRCALGRFRNRNL